MIGEAIEELRPFRVAMRRRFRRVQERSGVLLRGPAGWGEFSPFPEYGPAETASWLAAAIEAASRTPPVPRRRQVPVNTTVPALEAATARDLVARSGCRTAKVKVAEVGQGLRDDLDRVAAVREGLGPSGRIRIDANAAWDVDTAVSAIERLDRAAGGLEYAEQPCATLAELGEVRRRVAVPLAADESIRRAEDPLRVRGLEAADLVVIKVQPLGGIRRALAVVEAAGLPAVVSSAVETSVGLAAGVALAAALPELPFDCGLGTATLLASDVTDDPLVPVDGAVAVRSIAPAGALLDQHAPGPEQAAELLDRLAAAHDALVRQEAT